MMQADTPTPDMLEAALELYERGFSVIPLGAYGELPPPYFIERCDGDIEEAKKKWPKTPRISWKEYQRRTPTAEEVVSWWKHHNHANLAIVTGRELVVVDADSDEAIAWVDENLPRTPWRVRTGRGKQYYYQANKALVIHNSANANAKIDIRGVGGYVVAPPSIHPSGKQYEWEVDVEYGADSVMDLPILRHEDLQSIKSYNGDAPQQLPIPQPSERGNLNVDLSGIKAPSSWGGQAQVGERNNSAASLAGRYIAQGTSLRETMAILNHWNNNNPSPLAQQELEQVVASVAQTHNHNHPNQPIPFEPMPELQSPPREGLAFYTLKELQEMELDPPVEYWGPRLLIEGGRILLAGAAKIGKTDYTLNLAISLACSGKMLGWKANGPLKVAYLNAEVMKYYIKERVEAASKGLTQAQIDMLNANFAVTGRFSFDLLNNADFKQLYEFVKAYQPHVLFIDPFANIQSADENNAQEMREVMRRLEIIEAICGSAIVLSHHVGKGDISRNIDPFDKIRGSSVLRGWADTNIMLYRCEDQIIMTAYEVRNGPSPDPHPLWYDRPAAEWKIGTPDINIVGQDLPNNRREQDALDILEAHPQGLAAEAFKQLICERLEVSPRTAADLLTQLKRSRRVNVARIGKTHVYTVA